MPVQTRRRARSNLPNSASAEPLPSETTLTKPKKASPKKPTKKPSTAGKSLATSPKHRQPSPIPAPASPTGQHSAGADGKHKEKIASPKPQEARRSPSPLASPNTVNKVKNRFSAVLSEIGPLTKMKLLTPVNRRFAKTITQKQDPLLAKYRQAVGSELHRLSSGEDVLLPTAISQQVKAWEARRLAGASIVGKAVIGQIKTMGKDGLHSLLIERHHHGQRAAGVKRARSKSPTGRKIKRFAAAVRVPHEPESVRMKTLAELKQLTFNAAHRPSVVKRKSEVKVMHKSLHAEVLKAATVKEIRRLGEDGVLKALNPVN